jgi:hypothetical protein
MELLFHVFSEWLILRDTWPLSLPYHSPYVLYVWEAMSASVYSDTLYSLYHLKEVNSNFIKNIPHAKLVCVLTNKTNLVDACLQACADHFQHSCN